MNRLDDQTSRACARACVAYGRQRNEADTWMDDMQRRGEAWVVWYDSRGEGWRISSQLVRFKLERTEQARMAELLDPEPKAVP